jgi:guanylate kinase
MLLLHQLLETKYSLVQAAESAVDDLFSYYGRVSLYRELRARYRQRGSNHKRQVADRLSNKNLESEFQG